MAFLDYNVHASSICFLGAIADILIYYGSNIKESLLFGCSNGLRFRLKYNEKEPIESLWVECINFNHEDYNRLQKCISEYGYQLRDAAYNDGQELFSRLKEALDMGLPVMVSVDMYNLPYHNYYKRTHFDHIIVVHGIDEINRNVCIADCCTSNINKPCYTGVMEWSDFLYALSSDTEKKIWYIKKQDSNGNICSETFTPDAGNLTYMLPGMEEQGWNSCGIRAIEKLAEIYSHVSTVEMTDRIKELLRFHYCFLTGFGGPAVTRKLFANYLEDEAAEGLKQFAAESLELSNKWLLYSKNIMRAIIYEDMSILKKFLEKLKILEEKEESFSRGLLENAKHWK